MNESNYQVLNDLLKEFQEEYHGLQTQINECLVKVKEEECYVKSFLEKEDEDFKIFCPRNAEDIYRDEIMKANAGKSELQQKLNQFYQEQNLVSSKMKRLEQILKDENAFHFDTDLPQKNLTILNVQEEDRQRIARDLHDTSLQNLAHLVHKIELCGMFIDQDPIRAKLELAVISKNLKSVIEEIRNTIFDLRPMTFDDLGLKPAFEQLFEKINTDNVYDIEADIDNVSCENNLILATIFRVVQECLNNITKHADASKIVFSCRCHDNICFMDITDNGKGFSKEEVEIKRDRHFGLNVMKERIGLLGGKIQFDSEKTKGTHIHIEVPLL